MHTKYSDSKPVAIEEVRKSGRVKLEWLKNKHLIIINNSVDYLHDATINARTNGKRIIMHDF